MAFLTLGLLPLEQATTLWLEALKPYSMGCTYVSDSPLSHRRASKRLSPNTSIPKVPTKGQPSPPLPATCSETLNRATYVLRHVSEHAAAVDMAILDGYDLIL